MHLSENFTGLPEQTLMGIQVLGPNALLLCNVCEKEEKYKRPKMFAKGKTERKPTQSFEAGATYLKKSVQEIKSILNEKLSSRKLLPPSVQLLVNNEETKRNPLIDFLNRISIRGTDESEKKV